MPGTAPETGAAGFLGRDGLIAVYDRDRDYAEHLAGALSADRRIRWHTGVFTSEEALRGALEQENAFAVIGDGSEFSGMDARDFVKEKEGRCLLLSEGAKETGDSPHRVSRYQPAGRIIQDLLRICPAAGAAPDMRKLRVICFFTPISRCLQTYSALTLSQLLARRDRVLYLNMEPYSGLSSLVGREFPGSMAELLYYDACDRKKAAGILPGITLEAGGADLLPPADCPQICFGSGAAGWLSLFGTIEQYTDYRFLIVDMNASLPDYLEILRAGESILMLLRRDRIALAKFEAFARDVRARGYEDITVRIRKLYLPVFDALPPAFGNLLHGPLSEEMGKVAREILGKEEAL